MQSFKAANGEPLGIYPTHLVCGPKLMRTAQEITGATERLAYVDTTGGPGLQGSGTTAAAAASIPNVFAGDGLTLVISNRYTGDQDDYWHLMDLSKPAKPMMLKEERQWELIAMTDKADDRRFALDLYVWGLEADKAAAAGAWPLIYGGIVT
jgi:phage major head subunit gpT-like protein